MFAYVCDATWRLATNIDCDTVVDVSGRKQKHGKCRRIHSNVTVHVLGDVSADKLKGPVENVTTAKKHITIYSSSISAWLFPSIVAVT
jgi:hypothetical protein